MVKVRGITSESGYLAQVNSSGELSVSTVVNVGAVTVGISGQTIYLSATNVSGEFPPVYVTTSGQPEYHID